jgi:hypothetical protein
MTSPLELQNLFKAGLLAVEGVLPKEENMCHVIEEELRFDDLNRIVADAVLCTKTSAAPLTTKQWAAEARKATSRVNKPAPRLAPTAAPMSRVIDLKPAVEEFDEDEMLIGAEPSENGHVLVHVDGERIVSWTCPRRPALEIISYGFPRYCVHCGVMNPLESLLGTTDGEEDSF